MRLTLNMLKRSMKCPSGDVNETMHLHKECRQVQRSGNERWEHTRVITFIFFGKKIICLWINMVSWRGTWRWEEHWSSLKIMFFKRVSNKVYWETKRLTELREFIWGWWSWIYSEDLPLCKFLRPCLAAQKVRTQKQRVGFLPISV